MKANAKTLLGAGALAAFTASLCCIAPLLALLAGVGGATVAFSFLEPLHPYLTIVTIATLGLAWYQHLKATQAEACGCEPGQKKSLGGSKVFLGAVTVFALLMLTFPAYAPFFYLDATPQAGRGIGQGVRKVAFQVKGMTCSGCEKHVEDQVSKVPGVIHVKASYDKSNAVVEFEPANATLADLQKAIDSIGYKTLSHKSL